ncbi:TPA: hypothetical protein ACGOVA_001700 [Streptococcus suis]
MEEATLGRKIETNPKQGNVPIEQRFEKRRNRYYYAVTGKIISKLFNKKNKKIRKRIL